MEPNVAEIAMFLARVLRAAAEGRVVLTEYAEDRALDELGWSASDVIAQLLVLEISDFHQTEHTRGDALLWVFTPDVDEVGRLWIRLVERQGIVVVSFHPG